MYICFVLLVFCFCLPFTMLSSLPKMCVLTDRQTRPRIFFLCCVQCCALCRVARAALCAHPSKIFFGSPWCVHGSAAPDKPPHKTCVVLVFVLCTGMYTALYWTKKTWWNLCSTLYNLIMVSHPEWVGPVFVRIETDTPLGLRFQGANVHFFQMSES